MQRLLAFLAVAVIVFPALMTASCAPSGGNRTALKMGSASALPAHVHEAPSRVREAYQFAMANPEALRNVPCYCGCAPLGHKNNYDCYITGANADGTFIYDEHALGCQICVDITQDVMRYTRAGKSPGDIRTAIDTTYSHSGPSNMP